MELFKIYWEALAGYRRKAVLLVFLLGLSGLLEGMVLLTLIPILNTGNAIETDNQTWYLWLQQTLGLNPDQLLIASFTAFIITGLLSAAVMLFGEGGIIKLRAQIEGSLRKKISNALLRMSWTNYHSMRLGDISKSILMEPHHIAQGVWHFLLGVGSIFTALLFSVTAMFLSMKMTLITLAFVAVIGIGYKIVEKKALEHSKNWSSLGASIGDGVTEVFGNLKFFRSTGRSLPAEKKTNAIYDESSHNFFWSQVYNTIMRCAYQSAGILFLGAILALSLLSYKLPLPELVVLLAVFYRMVPRLRGVQEQFYQARTFQTWFQSWKTRYDFVMSHQETHSGNQTPQFKKGLQVKNLGFNYPPSNQTLLNGIDFNLGKKQCVALVGESGSGKSTLIDLVTGLLKPSSGDIILDGVSLNDLDINEWRSKIGLVIQESPIFHTTVLENIAWGCEDQNPESAKRCAQLAHAWEFIETLPEGLNTVVGEKGGRFSVGQKQRLALARALYRDPWLLILDEATSALDGESEKIIQESLKSLKGQFAIFMVAHRLKTVQLADTIIVLGGGRILEQGTWTELISKPSGAFRKMAELQGLVDPAEKVERA